MSIIKMNTLEKLQNIVEAQNKVRKDIEFLQEDERQLEISRLEAAKLYIKEAGLLSCFKFKASIISNNKIHVRGDLNDGSVDVIDLLHPSWHCHFEIDKGVTLYFDNNEVTLAFDDGVSAADFLRNNNINIDLSGIEEDVNALQNSLNVSMALLNSLQSQ